MEMRPSSHRRATSTPLDVAVTGGFSACSTMDIAWDASQGKSPWTLTVAAINHAPVTLSVENVPASKDFSYQWPIPLFSTKNNTQAFVAVADSSGDNAGVSSLQTILPPLNGATCSQSSEDLDFVWYPTQAEPTECADWKLNWETDKANAGITGTVSFSFLPEKGIPLTVSGGSSKATGALTFQVPFDATTKMAVIANDGGKYGTGGVGDLYTVASGKGNCKTPKGTGNGLPSGGSVVQAAASSSTSGVAASSTSNAATAKSSGSDATDANTDSSLSSSSDGSSDHSSHGGTAAGAAVGSLAAIAVIVALLFWWIRRRKRMQDDSFYGGAYGSREKSSGGAGGVSPWRWSVSPHAQGAATTGRTQRTVSGWFRQTFDRPSHDGGQQGRGISMADAASSPAFRGREGSLGHRATESYSSSSQFHHQNLQQVHHRTASITAASGFTPSDGYLPGTLGDDNFSTSSPYTGVSSAQGRPTSSLRTVQSGASTVPTSSFPPPTPKKSMEDSPHAKSANVRPMSKLNSVQTVVPDDSLFPPPRPALGQRTNSNDSAPGSPFNDGSSLNGTSDDGKSVSSRRRLVVDNHLIPPPKSAATPSHNVRNVLTPVSERSVGTPVEGYGAGVGSYAGLSRNQQGAGGYGSPRQDSKSPFADPSSSYSSAAPVQRTRSPQSEVSMLASPASTSVSSHYPTSEVMMGGPAPVGPPSGTSYIPPIGPTNTSVFDPYAHMSSYWQDQDDMQRRIREAGGNSAAAVQQRQQQKPSAPPQNPLQAPLATASTPPKDAAGRRILEPQRAGGGSARSSDLDLSGDSGGLPYL